MIQCGSTSLGAPTARVIGAQPTKKVGRIYIPRQGFIPLGGFRCHLDGAGGGGADQIVKPVAYDSLTNGEPGNLIGFGSQVNIVNGMSNTWVDFILDSVGNRLFIPKAGDYWFGLQMWITSNTVRWYHDNSAPTTHLRYTTADNYETYPSSPDAVFGAATAENGIPAMTIQLRERHRSAIQLGAYMASV